MAAIDRLEATKKRISLCAKSVGFDVLQENFKLNIVSYMSIFDCISYMFINGYDIKLFWGDFQRVVFCMVTWSYGYECSARIIVFTSKNKIVRNLYGQVYRFVTKMERDMTTNVIVRKFTGYIDVQTKGIVYLFYVCGFGTTLYPLGVYLITKDVILPFGFVIPGLSDIEQPGYTLNYSHHVLQVILTIGGLVTAQCINMLFLVAACMMIEILIAKLKLLGREVYRNDDMTKNVDFTEIIQLHQEILEFVKTLESLFSVMFLIDVFAISFQLILTLIVCSQSIWIPGCAIMMVATFMLLIDCGYGLYIELKFDALNAAVYDLPWHLMSIKDRKTVIFMLARTQKPPLLTFGKMAYMNMSTFVQIYKSIYSYFMVVKSFEA